MIYLVLGMHKSGTTLLARALHESGIRMGEEFPTGGDYARVKYEARWAQEINDEILGADRGTLSLDITSALLPKDELDQTLVELMRSRINESNSTCVNWGFKDPRAVLTYPYWKKLLPEHRLIIVYRHPLEVWKRYSGFNRFWNYKKPLQVWCDYNNQLLSYIKLAKKDDYIVVNFERLIEDTAEWNRLQAFVGSDLVDVRDPSQSVNRLSGKEQKSLANRYLMLAGGRCATGIYRYLEDVRVVQIAC